MQSTLDSSCQEADFIINNTLLKLQGSAAAAAAAASSNTSNVLYHQTASTSAGGIDGDIGLATSYQIQTQPQSTLLQSSTGPFHTPFSSSTSSLLHNITQIPSQPPAYIFDGVDSPPDYNLTTLTDEELQAAAAAAVAAAAADQQQQNHITSDLPSPTLLSNINSIISPSPIVPDTLLSTPVETSPPPPSLPPLSLPPPLSISPVINIPASNSSKSQPQLQMHLHSQQKPGKRSVILNDVVNIGGGNNSNSGVATSSPKKPRYNTSNLTYGTHSTTSPPLLQPLSSTSSSSFPANTMSVIQQQHPTLISSINNSAGSLNSNLNQQSQQLHQQLQQKPLSSGASTSTNMINNSILGGINSGFNQNTSPTPSKFFDIFEKIRELYLYLLIHDEKSLKEHRRRHRTRSFVLERLVEREKLNTVVLNLHPGNKGYSLAFYQNDKNVNSVNNEKTGGLNNNNYHSNQNYSIDNLPNDRLSGQNNNNFNNLSNDNNINNLNNNTSNISNNIYRTTTQPFSNYRINNIRNIGGITSNSWSRSSFFNKVGTTSSRNKIQKGNKKSSSQKQQPTAQPQQSSLFHQQQQHQQQQQQIESNNPKLNTSNAPTLYDFDENDFLDTSSNNAQQTDLSLDHDPFSFIDETIPDNLFLDFDDPIDLFSCNNIENNISLNTTTTTAATHGIGTNNISININSNSINATEKDNLDDKNLIEVMRWPYEVDDVLQSIDNEALPQIFIDLLENRTPNVFYSGCIICQVRDFRQTFPISPNSCDIYHVLLRPTNDTLYADIQQLQSDNDLTAEEKLQIESQLILATAEPLCLDPDPRIGRFAINQQFKKQMFNTQKMRRQMKKYSQISINRKRKTDQFTHNYGLELCDYLQRIRQRPRVGSSATSGLGNSLLSSHMNSSTSAVTTGCNTSTNSATNTTTNLAQSIAATTQSILSSFSSKLPKKPVEVMKSMRVPNLDYPPLTIPDDVQVQKYAKAYERSRETKDCMPQIVEEYILETDREGGRVYHIKLSIYQRPANSEYLGELYVDRDYRKGERNGESCHFTLGTRAHANRYIQQFTEIFTEEGRKSVKITHLFPGQNPKVTLTSGMTEHIKQQQQQQQQQQQHLAQQQLTQQALVALAQQQQQQQLQHQAIITTVHNQQQQTQQQHQQHIQIQSTPQLITSATGNQQLNLNIQGGNIVGITTSGGNVQHIRQQPTTQQFIDATGATVQVQTQTRGHHQLSLSNGSLVLVQQQPGQNSSGVTTGLTIQTASGQQKIINASQLAAATGASANALRAQLSSSVPILQAQLKAAPIITTTNQQQQIIQQKNQSTGVTTTMHSTNPTINALVTGFMNTANQLQQQQQQSQQSNVHSKPSSSGNAAILSLLNSAPAAMTSTPVASSTFTTISAGQSQATLVPQQQQQSQSHPAIISTEAILQQHQQQQNAVAQQRKQNEVIQNLLNSNLRKINMVTTGSGQTTTSRIINQGGNLIAVNVGPINQQQHPQQQQSQQDNNNATQQQTQTSQQTQQIIVQQQQPQSVRVTMSALATQLASPPAVMTNANATFYTAAAATNTNLANNSNSIALSNNNIKILNNTISQPSNNNSVQSQMTPAVPPPPPPVASQQQQRIISTTRLSRDSSTINVAAPSPGSDSNQSNQSATSNLGFAMPGLSALLAAPATPSPSANVINEHSTQVQPQQAAGQQGTLVGITQTGQTITNQTLLERLNSGTNMVGANSPVATTTQPGLSPQQSQQQQQQTQKSILQQQIVNVQSPVPSISPMSSPPPQQAQPSPQQQHQQHQTQQQIQITPATLQHNSGQQTTTLNLVGTNLSSLSGAIATFPSLQNVQVQIPGLAQPIHLSVSGASLSAALQQQHNAIIAAAQHQQHQQNNQQQQQTQQTTSLLVSVPVTSTTQTIQTVPGNGGNNGTPTLISNNNNGIGNNGGNTNIVTVPASVAATQTVVLTNASGQNLVPGTHSLSLPLAQLVASGVKMHPQTIRAVQQPQQQQQQQSQQAQQNTSVTNVVNTSNIIQATGLNTSSIVGGINNVSLAQQNAVNTNLITSNNVTAQTNPTGNIQLLGTLQQRPRSIQVVGAKQLSNRSANVTIAGNTGTNQIVNTQRSIGGQTLKIATPISGKISSSQLTTANLTANPLVMTTQKLQLKFQKQGLTQQQQQTILQTNQQQQQQQIISNSNGGNLGNSSNSSNINVVGQPQQQPQQQQPTQQQRIITAAAAVAMTNQANQKRRRSATDVNK